MKSRVRDLIEHMGSKADRPVGSPGGAQPLWDRGLSTGPPQVHRGHEQKHVTLRASGCWARLWHAAQRASVSKTDPKLGFESPQIKVRFRQTGGKGCLARFLSNNSRLFKITFKGLFGEPCSCSYLLLRMCDYANFCWHSCLHPGC